MPIAIFWPHDLDVAVALKQHTECGHCATKTRWLSIGRGRARRPKSGSAAKIAVVIVVSCNVATFARNARTLIDGGHKIASVTPVDRFVTRRVESVAR
jgi:hypothetical protein